MWLQFPSRINNDPKAVRKANTLECHDFLSEHSTIPRTSKIPQLSTPTIEERIHFVYNNRVKEYNGPANNLKEYVSTAHKHHNPE